LKSKRYVLLEAEGDVSESSWEELCLRLEESVGRIKPISMKGNPRALVLKTDNRGAPLLRQQVGAMTAGGFRVRTSLTSGCIGKLKRRAGDGGATEVGKVSER